MCNKSYDDKFPELDEALQNPDSRKIIEENQSSFIDDETADEAELNDRQYQEIKKKKGVE